MSEPLDLPALDEAATLLDDETPSIGALAVMKRGIKVSPELRAGLAITVVMALTAAVGRLIVPILVQLVLDNGVLSDDGYDGAYVWTVSMAALAVVLLVAAASRVALIRLVDMAETVLMNLRVRVFEHIHRLSLADHTESRRGVLVARVTSDVETLARFTQWGLISWIIDTAIIVGTIASRTTAAEAVNCTATVRLTDAIMPAMHISASSGAGSRGNIVIAAAMTPNNAPFRA